MSEDVLKGIFLVGFVVGSVIRRVYTRGRRRREAAVDHRWALDSALVMIASLGLVVAPVLYLATPWLDFADYRLPAWTGAVGAPVFAAALWLLWRSHVDLGRQWSAVPQIMSEHSLVTTGVFRRIRHPMYAAHWLWGIAQALLLQNWMAGPALLVTLLPLYLFRAPREEKMLLAAFGDEYRSYMSRTGRLLPRLRG